MAPPRPRPPVGPSDPENPSYAGGRRVPVPVSPPKPKTVPPGTPGYAGDIMVEFPNNDVGEFGTPQDYWDFRAAVYADPEGQRWAYANGGDRYVNWAWRALFQDEDSSSDEFIARGLIPPDDDAGSGRSTGRGGGGFGRGGGGGGSGGNVQQQYDAAIAAIRNQARTMGLELDDASITSLAQVVVDNNWSGDMVNDYLAGGAASNPAGVRAGSFTSAVDMVKAAASAQLMPISDASAQEWAGRIVSGEMDVDGLRSMVAAMAKVKYGWAATVIDQGVTMRDFLLPSRDRVAQELEMNAEAVDLLDPRWQSMMYVTDDKGQTRAATDSEIVTKARKTDEFKSTKRAGDMAAGIATMLRDRFEGRA